MPKRRKPLETMPPMQAGARYVMRFASIRSDSATDPAKGIPIVIATESAVSRVNEDGEVIGEVLLMDGMELRGGRSQVPIVDSHDDSTIRNVLGSVRNMRIEGDALVGEAFFAHDDESQAAQQKLMDGHITDFSITAMPDETSILRRGQEYTTSRGSKIVGPAEIITKWTTHNASICATGADVRSSVRRSYEAAQNRGTAVAEETGDTGTQSTFDLSSLGVPEGMTDPTQIIAFLAGKLGSAASATEPVENASESPAEPPKEESVDKPKEDTAEAVEKAIRQFKAADTVRRKEIQALCTVHKIERSFGDELCESGATIEVAREKVLERMATKPIGQNADRVEFTASEDDKFAAAARDGLLMRAAKSAGIRRNMYDGDKPAAGAEDFRNQSILRIAETYLRRQGVSVERMAAKDVAMVAMGHQPTINRLRIQRSDGAYHTTGSFTNLLLDAANKTLLAGYEEAAYTWNVWARQAPAVADFKAINRVRFSESPDLVMVPENSPYPEGTMSDAKTSYKVEKFGSMFTVSWETVVNDDLDAISRVPAQQGVAARRTQNKKVYEVLTSNPTMSDGKALFATDHASGDNTSGAAAAPSVTTLNAGFLKMMLQKGLNAATVVGVEPRFLIVPASYAATAMQLLNSTADPAAGGSAAGNSNTANIYGPSGGRGLQLVFDQVLDASSTTVWYLAADNAQIDTVELAFLQGEESPVMEAEWDFTRDVYLHKIRQTFGVAPIDWRGLYRNAA